MPGLVVVNGAQLRCDKCPGAISELAVTGGLVTPQIGGQEVATVTDHVPGVNIPPFLGDCKTTHKPCDPQTPFHWLPGESSALLPGFVPLVSETAVLLCTRGAGVLQIVAAGQSTINISLPPDPECTPPPEPGLFESLLDTLMMTDVANAPTLDSCIVDSMSQLEQILGFTLTVTPGVGVAARAGKLTRGATRATATTAVTAELVVSRYPAIVAARQQIVMAAHRAAHIVRRHKVKVGPDGLPTSDDPKVAAALTAIKQVIKEAFK